MRIGILTFHRSYNYGAFMQCYSLVNKLKSDFPTCQVEVIDYNTKRSADSYRVILSNQTKESKQRMQVMFDRFDEIRTQYLPVSPEYIETDDKDELFRRIKKRYDIIIVGSDAVWNWVEQPFPNAYMLDNCDDSVIKMSYAASSHGQSYKGFDEKTKEYIRKSLSSFKYLGVREQETENLLRFVGVQNNIFQNCDPTVLLDLNALPVSIDDVRRKLEQRGIDFKKPIIGLMAAEPYGKAIKEYFGDSVQLVSVYKENKYSDFFLYDLNPFEWALVFSLFNVTVTHFFHGTMLSLINHTPVLSVEKKSPYSGNYTTKIHNALYNMNLEMFYYLIDIGKRTFLNRALYKLNIKESKELWFCICNRIEELIDNPPKERIASGIAKEAEKYISFKQELNTIIYK